MNKSIFSLLVISCLHFSLSMANDTVENLKIDALKINQIQTIGSHNSYHLRGNKFVLRFLKGLRGLLPKSLDPRALDYAHEPLTMQLDSFHLRSVELDIYADPNGGQFYYRKKNNLLGKPKPSGIAELKQPGFKIMHIPDIDYNTTNYTFVSALSELKKWSDAHPTHLPIYILVECKEETIAEKISNLHFATAIPFSINVVNDIDKEIKSVFGDSLKNVITPDIVRGNYPTLREAVLADHFPTIAAARGKFIFVLMEVGSENYLQNHPSLQGRAMFTFSTPDRPECAFIKYDDAKENELKIIEAVKKGFMVRTRADEPFHQNRTGDYTQQQAAIRSGAQIISSDYYTPDMRYKKHPKKYKNYFCKFQGSDIARINTVSFSAAKIEE